MTRKLIMSAVLATGTLTGVVATACPAGAEVPALLPHHRFEVLARRNGSDWQSQGTFRLHAHAEVLAIRLRHQGFRVEIKQF
jgi:hypothetical protein